MIKVLVLDLDNTLIKGDSFKLWAFLVFCTNPLQFIHGLTSEAFGFRIKFKRTAMSRFCELEVHVQQKITRIIVERISKRIPDEFYEFYSSYKPNHVVLISASPEMYVVPLAKHLQFDGFGSFLENEVPVILKGPRKLEVLTKYLNGIETDAILVGVGDSSSDWDFLRACNHAFILRNRRCFRRKFNSPFQTARSWKEMMGILFQ